MDNKDYIYCEDCEEFVDFWKYDDILETGHSKCNWRYATHKEVIQIIKWCEQNVCS